jgi:hypothetical protein
MAGIFIFIFLFLIRQGIHVNFLKPAMWASVNFWTEVPYMFLAINEIPSIIRNKSSGVWLYSSRAELS